MESLVHIILLLSAMAAGSLVNAVVEGLVLVAAVGLCLRLLPGIRPATRFTIWAAVLLAVLPLHFTSLFGIPSETASPISISSFHLDTRLGLLIACLWGALSLVRSVRLVRSALELRRVARNATPILDRPALAALANQEKRRAQLCTSVEVDRPSVAGFFHPRILLPPELLQRLSEQELEQIVLHEVEHLRRRDDWTNLIQKISLILFPLNPVLHWIERRLCIERELACDDCVLHTTSARKAYAACLTSLAEHSLLRRGITLALGAWERQSELSRRVHRILRRPERRMGRTAANLVTGTVIAGLAGGAVTLAHSPALVSFLPTASTSVQASAPATESAEPVARPVLQPVRPGQSFSPTLVKAVMPEPQAAASAQHRSTPARRRSSVVRTVRRQPPSRPENWIVLTRWRVVSVSPRPSLTVSEGMESSSFAAVSIRNGWLVIQL